MTTLKRNSSALPHILNTREQTENEVKPYCTRCLVAEPARVCLITGRQRRRPRWLENPQGISMPGKRVQFDDETWHALNLLARDRMQDFQELADEAFRDLLEKHGRPTDLKTALRRSVDNSAIIKPDFKKRPPARRPPAKKSGTVKR
jgi:hypothetical protein